MKIHSEIHTLGLKVDDSFYSLPVDEFFLDFDEQLNDAKKKYKTFQINEEEVARVS